MSLVNAFILNCKKRLRGFLAVLALIAACALIAGAVVYPLWKFALAAPEAYTRTVCAILLVFLLAFIFFRIKRAYFADAYSAEQKKQGWLRFILLALRTLVAAGGLCAFVFCVSAGRRAIGFAALLAAVALNALAAVFSASLANKTERAQDPEESIEPRA